MNNFLPDKIFNLIGLCKRAGRVSSGEQAVLESIKTKKSCLVIISEDASENTKKKITDKCQSYKIKHIFLSDRWTLGKYIKKEYAVLISVNDRNFAEEILKILFLN